MSISRRGFVGAAVGAVLSTDTTEAGGARHFPGYSGRYGLLHDTTLCIGCRSCELACQQANDIGQPTAPVDDPSVFDRQRRTTDTELTVVNRYREATDGQPAVFRKHQCMHCNEPCCATVCPVHAFEKTPEGPVLYDPDLCMGCRYCVMACPYYALAYEYDNPLTPRVMRCTMCYPRIKEGLEPACAEACPMGAITFGHREDLIKVARERLRKYPGRYVEHIFGEHEFGGTSWLVLAGTEFRNIGLPDDVSLEPLPAIATSYLGVVPLVITIYPGLLLGLHAFSRRQQAVAREEREAAVAAALSVADQDARQKLAKAAEKAAKDQERAVDAAVKKALQGQGDGGGS